MTDKVVVYVTCGSSREARKIARALVEKRLAACVNLVGPIQSLFRWEGKLCDAREYLLIIKSSRRAFGDLRRLVGKLHSYEVAEVICLPILEGSAKYLAWMDRSLARAR